MISILALSLSMTAHLFAVLGPLRLLYSIPLITSVSLVCVATRHEDMNAILIHALRFAIWIVVFMGIVLCVIQFLTWLQ